MACLDYRLPKGVWKNLNCSGTVPSERSGHISVLYKERYMYVIGGADNISSKMDVYYLDLQTHTWHTSYVDSPGSDPQGRCSHGGVIDEVCGLIYVFGGSQTHGDNSMNDMHTFNVHTHKWTRILQRGSIPIARNGHSMLLYKDCIILFGGGQVNRFFNDLYSFDTLSRKWSCKATTGITPAARLKHTVNRVKDQMILIGGYTALPFYVDIWTLDLKYGHWSQIYLEMAPEGRFSHSSEVFKGRFCIFGGNIFKRKGDLHKFSLDRVQWKEILQKGELPRERSFHSSESSQEYFFVFGGINSRKKLNDTKVCRVKNFCKKKTPHLEYNHRSETGVRVICQNGFLYCDLIWLLIRIPLIFESVYKTKIHVPFSYEVGILLFSYIHNEIIDFSCSLRDLLELLSVSVRYGITCMNRQIIIYLTKVIDSRNAKTVLKFVESHLSEDLAVFGSLKKNFYSEKKLPVPIKQYLLQKTQTLSYEVLAEICKSFIVDDETELSENTEFPESLLLYSDPSASTLQADLELLYSTRYMADVNIITEEGCTYAHKFILVKGSKFFESCLAFSNSDEVKVKTIPLLYLEMILKYMYIGSSALKLMAEDDISAIMFYADSLLLKNPYLFEYGGSLISKDLSLSEATGYLSWALKSNLITIRDKMIEYLAARYDEWIYTEDYFQLDEYAKSIVQEYMSYF